MRCVGASREVSRLSGCGSTGSGSARSSRPARCPGSARSSRSPPWAATTPTTSDSYLQPTFAAVFLGTAIIEPGRFNPIGTFIGIYFLETGILGLQLLGLQAWVSPVFYGCVLVVAVAISTLLHRRTT
jgi:ribose transport system permease protein